MTSNQGTNVHVQSPPLESWSLNSRSLSNKDLSFFVMITLLLGYPSDIKVASYSEPVDLPMSPECYQKVVFRSSRLSHARIAMRLFISCRPFESTEGPLALHCHSVVCYLLCAWRLVGPETTTDLIAIGLPKTASI